MTLLTGLPDDPIASKVLLCILPPGAQGGKRGSLCFVPLAAIEKNANSPVLIPLHNLREMCEGKQSSRFQGINHAHFSLFVSLALESHLKHSFPLLQVVLSMLPLRQRVVVFRFFIVTPKHAEALTTKRIIQKPSISSPPPQPQKTPSYLQSTPR